MTTNIDCKNFELVLNEVLDARRSVTSEQSLVDHAEHCIECSEMYVAFVELEHGLSGLQLLSSNNPEDHNCVEIAAERPNLSFGRYGALGFVASVAVALAIMIFVSSMDFGDRSSSSFAKQNNRSEVAGATANLNQGLMGQTAEGFKKPAVEIRPLGSNVLAELSDQISQSPYYQVSAELPYVRPLRSSIGVAIGLIQKSFTQESEQRDDKDPELGYRVAPQNWKV